MSARCLRDPGRGQVQAVGLAASGILVSGLQNWLIPTKPQAVLPETYPASYLEIALEQDLPYLWARRFSAALMRHNTCCKLRPEAPHQELEGVLHGKRPTYHALDSAAYDDFEIQPQPVAEGPSYVSSLDFMLSGICTGNIRGDYFQLFRLLCEPNCKNPYFARPSLI